MASHVPRRILVAGLGNTPYPYTRHSLGHVVVDGLANRWRIRMSKSVLGWSGQSIVHLAGGHQVSLVLLKPSTLMNVSGPPIAQAAKRADDLFVLHDSIDNKVGKVSVVHDAPVRGHNGLRSVRAAYPRPFWSVRLGIGRPLPGEDLAEFVLDKLSVRERDHWEIAGVGLVADALELALLPPEARGGKPHNFTFRPQSRPPP